MNRETAHQYNVPLFQTAWFKMLLIQPTPEKIAERIADEISIKSQYSAWLFEYFGESLETITLDKFEEICQKIYLKTY